MMRRIWCIGAAVCLSVSLVGCSGDDGDGDGNNQMDSGQPEPDVATDTLEPDMGVPPEDAGMNGEDVGSDVGSDTTADVDPGPRFEELASCPGSVAQTVTVGPGNVYQPADATIAPGEVVKWEWNGGTHNVKAAGDSSCGNTRSDWFGSSTLTGRGNTYCVRFNEVGTWNYQCTVTGHCADGMKGTVTVEAP